MKKARNIDASVVRQLLSYSPETGELRWKERPIEFFSGTFGRTPEHARNHWNARHAGKIPGATDTWGHTQIKLFGRLFAAHRLIWLHVTGEWPKDQIDHIDCNPSNNKWSNLRLATNQQNSRNQRAGKSNKSGIKGVCWVKARRKWKATIRHNYQHIHLGYFDKIEDAASAYEKAAAEYHGEFARTSPKD